MAKKPKGKQQQTTEEKGRFTTGDKKLDGPNRPST
ncbi:spore protein [Metabacillus sediminilitoris]|jgi:hypothetical protein|nr:spore protein [Metabacillus sediminilitoris]